MELDQTMIYELSEPFVGITARYERNLAKVFEDRELSLEVRRHHRDFVAISVLVEQALSGEIKDRDALRQIRNIVG